MIKKTIMAVDCWGENLVINPIVRHVSPSVTYVRIVNGLRRLENIFTKSIRQTFETQSAPPIMQKLTKGSPLNPPTLRDNPYTIIPVLENMIPWNPHKYTESFYKLTVKSVVFSNSIEVKNCLNTDTICFTADFVSCCCISTAFAVLAFIRFIRLYIGRNNHYDYHSFHQFVMENLAVNRPKTVAAAPTDANTAM